MKWSLTRDLCYNDTMSVAPCGTFYGVGVGPGDPELITRKAERVLRSVEWIFHPAAARSGSSFVRSIVAPLDLPAAKFREVALCMARDRGGDQAKYAETVRLIAGELRQGKSAAWIAEGDPLFYSTFVPLHEEMRRQFPEVRIEIVPGVSSIHAAAALAGLPAAQLDDRVAVLPAAYGLERLAELARDFDTIFLLKVNTSLDDLIMRLDRLPAAFEAAYVEKVGAPDERLVTNLHDLAGQNPSYFSLVILRKKSR